MPFIAPIVAGALGVGFIGEALIGGAIAFGLGAAARALAPKPRSLDSAGRGMRLSLSLNSDQPREIAVGRAALAGSLVYHNVYGPNGNDNLELVFALSDCACDALESLYVDGVAQSWNSSTGEVSNYAGMTVTFYAGNAGQSADSALVANSTSSRWQSSSVGVGMCYAVVRMSYNSALYPTGLPRFLFVIRGAKLYDWRKDSTAGGSGSHRWGTPSTYEWTQNPVVIAYNYRRGIYSNGQRIAGMNAPATAFPLADWTAAANACDESVTLKAGGTEPRYRCNGVISTSIAHQENLRDVYMTCSATEYDNGGSLRPIVGVAQTAVMSFTDDDITDDADTEIRPKQPRSRLVNAVFGSFHDPALGYQSTAAAPRLSPTDEATDGGIRLEQHYALDFVTSQTQSQRILEILRRRERRQTEVSVKVRARFAVLEAGDWVSWTSDRYGYDAQPFEVQSAIVGPDMSVTLSLREIDASVFAWTAGTDELDPLSPAALPAGGGGITSLSGLAIAAIEVVSDGTASRPGLQLTWTPVTDSSVVAVEIEVRRFGDTGAGTLRRALDPTTGQYSWVDGIQGQTTYEVRARPVTQPERSVSWSGWIHPTAATESQIVEVAATSLAVAPESVGLESLDAQTRFELSLVTALSTLQGSYDAQREEMFANVNRAGEEALRALLYSNDTKTLIRTEQIQRQTDTTAIAAEITTIGTTVADNTTTITAQQASIDGIAARWGVVINSNNQVVGLVQLDGGVSGSTFQVVADKFIVAHPTSPSTTQQVFTIGTINGVASVGIAGNVIIDGTVLARHLAVSSLSAIAADVGTVTAGILKSSDNKMIINLNTKSITMST